MGNENTQTVDELFAALMGEEGTKLAGDEETAGDNGKGNEGEQDSGKGESSAASGEGENKEAAEALSKIAASMNLDQIKALSSWVEDMEAQEKRAELEKEAEEAKATGRFMARGFIEELNKLSAEGGYDESLELADFDAAEAAGGANVPTPKNDIVQDGSKAMSQAKKEDASKSPQSPTASQDVVQVVKSIVQAANVASKGQDPQEVPNNLSVKETATSGNKGSQPNNVA